MKIIENIKDLKALLNDLKAKNHNIGLIPTMGSIHKGHLSLVKKSLNYGLFSLVTIYVNPTQFNSKVDYINYPRNKLEDIKKLKRIKCDAVYFPKDKDIYPKGYKILKSVKQYRKILCDKFRPGHFDGVITVVRSLLSLTNPKIVFFGEKDFQQLKIIEILITNFSIPTKINKCKSIRYTNGMSISSRYKNFTKKDKIIFNNSAKEIKKTLNKYKKNFSEKEIKNLNVKLLKIGVKKIDYLEIRNENSLLKEKIINKPRLFLAIYIGQIRIIDNFILY